MTQRAKQSVKPVVTAPRKSTTKPTKPVAKPSQPTEKPRQKRKPKQVKNDEAVMFNKALDYLGNYLLFVGVSAIILALAYWFMNMFD